MNLSVFSMLPPIRQETYWSLAESVNHLITTQITIATYHGIINWEPEGVTINEVIIQRTATEYKFPTKTIQKIFSFQQFHFVQILTPHIPVHCGSVVFDHPHSWHRPLSPFSPVSE